MYKCQKGGAYSVNLVRGGKILFRLYSECGLRKLSDVKSSFWRDSIQTVFNDIENPLIQMTDVEIMEFGHDTQEALVEFAMELYESIRDYGGVYINSGGMFKSVVEINDWIKMGLQSNGE